MRDYAIDLKTIKNVSDEFQINRDVNRYSNTLPIEWKRIVSQSTKKILLLQKQNDSKINKIVYQAFALYKWISRLNNGIS